MKLPLIEPYSDDELLASRPQRMKKRYANGLSVPFDRVNHSKVMCFIKNEKMHWTKPKPRCINYRNSIFTAQLAKYIVPIERTMSHHELEDNYQVPFMSKGRNAIEVAALLRQAYDESNKSYIHLIDHSAYDGSITTKHQMIEFAWYKRHTPHQALQDLLKCQLDNKILSRNGVRVKCKGVRMSGDANTSLGNSVINYMMLRYQYPDSCIVVNGDDSVVFTNQELPLHEWSEVGMVSKFSVVKHFEEIEYCQSVPVLVGKQWVMMREPLRAMSRMAYRLTVGSDSDWFRTLGTGEMHSNPYDPFMQCMAQAFIARGREGRFRSHMLEYRNNVGWTKEVLLATQESTVAWQAAFGICDMQMRTMMDMVSRQCCYDKPTSQNNK